MLHLEQLWIFPSLVTSIIDIYSYSNEKFEKTISGNPGNNYD